MNKIKKIMRKNLGTVW